MEEYKEFGARIYYNKLNGDIIFQSGDVCGYIEEPQTIEEDLVNIYQLSAFPDKENIGCYQSEYNEISKGFEANPDTNDIKIDISSPEDPKILYFHNKEYDIKEEPQVPYKDEIDVRIDKAKNEVMTTMIKMFVTMPTTEIKAEDIPPLTSMGDNIMEVVDTKESHDKDSVFPLPNNIDIPELTDDNIPPIPTDIHK